MFILLLLLSLNIHAGVPKCEVVNMVLDIGTDIGADIRAGHSALMGAQQTLIAPIDVCDAYCILCTVNQNSSLLCHRESQKEYRVAASHLQEILQGTITTTDPLLLAMKDYNTQTYNSLLLCLERTKTLSDALLVKHYPSLPVVDDCYLVFWENGKRQLIVRNTLVIGSNKFCANGYIEGAAVPFSEFVVSSEPSHQCRFIRVQEMHTLPDEPVQWFTHKQEMNTLSDEPAKKSSQCAIL
ncbi:MAG: hypothetical protein OXC30_01985 [Alphaproteobacteria bacterium]|nr:hypothetical protein [Alphaproteobacteria bacterium]